MAEKVECKACDRIFKNEDGLIMHNKAKHPERIPKEKKPLLTKKSKNWSIFIGILAIFIFGTYWIIANAGNTPQFPPTTMEGHTEASPKSHILKSPMSISIQKHMLEHVDGEEGGRGGVIINYNCDDYTCEEGLIENLESFANKYDYVYVAPFKNMPIKIALTKLGQLEKLEEYDEQTIESFITG